MKTILLPCGCHKLTSEGDIYSRLYQFSKKGCRGIQTEVGERWQKLKLTKTRKGYLQIALHGRLIRVHRLLAINFIPNPLAYPEVQHKNDIKTDNRICNLKWGNQKQNAADRDLFGKTRRGSTNKNAKLSEEQIPGIRELRKKGYSLNEIANRFSVSKKLILLILQGKIWKHVL